MGEYKFAAPILLKDHRWQSSSTVSINPGLHMIGAYAGDSDMTRMRILYRLI